MKIKTRKSFLVRWISREPRVPSVSLSLTSAEPRELPLSPTRDPELQERAPLFHSFAFLSAGAPSLPGGGALSLPIPPTAGKVGVDSGQKTIKKMDIIRGARMAQWV